MSKDEILNKIDDKLWDHFPDEQQPTGPSWQQRPYKDDLFKLCIQSCGIVGRDDVANYVRTQWNIRREHRLPPSVELQLDQFVDAWGEWQFAYQMLGASE